MCCGRVPNDSLSPSHLKDLFLEMGGSFADLFGVISMKAVSHLVVNSVCIALMNSAVVSLKNDLLLSSSGKEVLQR